MLPRSLWSLVATKYISRVLSLCLLLIMGWIFSASAHAIIQEDLGELGSKLDNSGQIMVGSGDLATTGQGLITKIFNLVISVSGGVFLVMVLVGGVQYLTGAGNEETTGKAKRLMLDAVIGLLLVLAAWPIGTFIIDRIK